MGYEVLGARSGLDAIRAVARQRFCLALVDIKMPNVGGQEAIMKMRQYDPQMPIILMTGSPGSLGWKLRMVCQGCLYKPFRLEQLRAMIEAILGAPSPKGARTHVPLSACSNNDRPEVRERNL